MENQKIIGLIMKTAKSFASSGPGAPGGFPGGPAPQGGPGAGGPPAEKKFLLMLNIATPDQPADLIGRMSGLHGPQVAEICKQYEEQGLITVKAAQDGDPAKALVSLSEAGRAKLEAERAEIAKKMEEMQRKHIEENNAKLAALTDEEKETLAALLEKIG